MQVIPPSRRSLAYALDSGMSGLINSCTIPVAGLVIERLGGHAVQKVAAAAGAGGDDAAAPAPAVAPADNLANARAIEDGLLYLILISYGVKIFVRARRPATPVVSGEHRRALLLRCVQIRPKACSSQRRSEEKWDEGAAGERAGYAVADYMHEQLSRASGCSGMHTLSAVAECTRHEHWMRRPGLL